MNKRHWMNEDGLIICSQAEDLPDGIWVAIELCEPDCSLLPPASMSS